MLMKKIIKEDTNKYIDKIFNLIKKSLEYDPKERLIINLGNINSMLDKRQGINITLKKDGPIGVVIKNYLIDSYGVTQEESSILWDMIRKYLKKLNFIEHVDWILYEDYLQWSDDPYYYDDPSGISYNVNKLGDLIEMMEILEIGTSDYDPHSEEKTNFLEVLNKEDYEYIQEKLLDRISSENNLMYENIKVKNMLSETPSDEEFNFYTDDIFSDKIYDKFFKLFDKNPNNIFQILKSLELEHEELTQPELEVNLINKYLTQYENRTPFHITFELDSEDISDLFYEDRDYNVRKMVKNYLDGDYEYDSHCFDVDDWLIEKIDSENMDKLKSIYVESLEGEEGNEEDFREFIEYEFGNEIGCSAGDAQFSADIDSLHNDFIRGIEDYLSKFDGHISSTRDGVKFIGVVEIGDLPKSPYFEDLLYDWLDTGYPSDFKDIFYDIKSRELNGYSYYDNYFFPEELIRINTDKHFRYGGAGDIDWGHFNEILSDRLNYL